MDSYFFAKLVSGARPFFTVGMPWRKSPLRIECSSVQEICEMANLYVEVKITWFFQTSPASFSFYADPNSDAFTSGRFDDSRTHYAVVEIVGNEALTLAQLKADLSEKFRHQPAVWEVKPIRKYEYIAGIERLKEECVHE
jgi:hypothetical protein